MKNTLLILVSILYSFNYTNAQCKITHLSGTQNYNGIDVTVTSEGDVGTSSTCNGLNSPYVAGPSTLPLPCDNGSFTFTFSSPISEITINIGDINGSAIDSEIVRFFINGMQFPVINLGDDNTCQQLPIITQNGDITSSNWLGAGMKNFKIVGNISSLKILDSIIVGCPNGAAFSVSICNSVSINEYTKNENHLIYPNPTSDFLNIHVKNEEVLKNKPSIYIYDMYGKCIKEEIINQNDIKYVNGEMYYKLDITTFEIGIYSLRMNSNWYKINKI